MKWWEKMRKMRGDRKAWSIAHDAGMSESQYSNYERGKFPDIKISTFVRLAKSLGCSVRDFFDDKQVKEPSTHYEISEPAKDVLKWWGEMNPKTRHLIYLFSQDIEEILHKKKPLKKGKAKDIVSYDRKSKDVRGG